MTTTVAIVARSLLMLGLFGLLILAASWNG